MSDIDLVAGHVTIPPNVHFYIDSNALLSVNKVTTVENLGYIFIYGTINHKNNVYNGGNGQVFCAEPFTAHVQGNTKFVNGGNEYPRRLSRIVTFDAGSGVFHNGAKERVEFVLQSGNLLVPKPFPNPTRTGYTFEGWYKELS